MESTGHDLIVGPGAVDQNQVDIEEEQVHEGRDDQQGCGSGKQVTEHTDLPQMGDRSRPSAWEGAAAPDGQAPSKWVAELWAPRSRGREAHGGPSSGEALLPRPPPTPGWPRTLLHGGTYV